MGDAFHISTELEIFSRPRPRVSWLGNKEMVRTYALIIGRPKQLRNQLKNDIPTIRGWQLGLLVPKLQYSSVGSSCVVRHKEFVSINTVFLCLSHPLLAQICPTSEALEIDNK